MSARAAVQLMILPAVGVVFQLCLGCAGQHADPMTSHDRQLQAAREERDAAVIEVAQAIGRYCALRTDSVEARQRCLIDQQVHMQFVGPLETGHRPDHPERESGSGQFMTCEAERRSTHCRRKPPAYAELWGSDLTEIVSRQRSQ